MDHRLDDGSAPGARATEPRTSAAGQLSLDDLELTHVRNTDPPTSHDAARRLDRRTLALQQAALLVALLSHPEGAICEVLSADIGNLPNRVARRLGDLREVGLVVCDGEVRRAKTRRLQLVHRLSPAGRVRAQQLAAEARRSA